MHAIYNTVAYLHSNVPEFIELENWPSNSPDLNPADFFSVDSVVADGVMSQNFRHWSAEASSDRLLGSTNPGHTELSDLSAAKRLRMVIKAKGGHVEFRLE